VAKLEVEYAALAILAYSCTQTNLGSFLVYNSSASSSYPGVLAGAGNTLIEISPAALLVLSGSSNSYTRGTNVEAGRLELTSRGALPDGTSLTVGTGGAMIFGLSLAAAPATNATFAGVNRFAGPRARHAGTAGGGAGCRSGCPSEEAAGMKRQVPRFNLQ